MSEGQIEVQNNELVFAIVKALEPKFDRIDERFERIDQRFEQIDEKFERIDQKFEQIDQKFDQVDQRLDRLEYRMDDFANELKFTQNLLVEEIRKTREYLERKIASNNQFHIV